MAFSPTAIHQFHGSTTEGDAITNGLLYTRSLLRSLGFRSEIYCEDVVSGLATELRSAPSFPDGPDVVLIIHFSWAIRFFDWLSTLKCRKVLVFHNITPPEFFEEGQDHERISLQSRQQLAALRPIVTASLSNSAYSARELEELGFEHPEVLPLLVDPAQWRDASYDEDVARRLAVDPCFSILFVGRIVSNKRQTDLLRVVHSLRSMMPRPVRLILPGSTGAGPGYGQELVALRDDLNLQDCVDFAGKVSDRHLRALYRGADVFLSMSEHEGFCVPLVEAMAFDLPVVALASSAIPETVGDGGLLLDDGDPDIVAATLKVLADEPELRRRLILAGRRNLDRFERGATLRRLAAFLREKLDIEIAAPCVTVPVAQPQWRIDGPFDSSYSLAAVNRSLARALARRQIDVGLFSTEGPGDFPPDPAFLADHPDVHALSERGQAMGRPEIVLRNLYPPRVTDIPAATRVLASWGWEESGLPLGWVTSFNDELNLITAVSRYVADLLVRNGVKVPIAVVGNGAEHVLANGASQRRSDTGAGQFRFLHVSSAFPRKGVDSLLEAWGQAFRRSDDVTLVLKTFPNPHNDIVGQLERFRQRHADHAEIVLIDSDLDDGDIAGLYQDCHALVLPSRGEGFGLPAAEAMLHGRPVITTAHGGMVDFCSDENAWLVDFEFRYAESHMALFNSVWADPIVEDLARVLKEVCAASPDARARKTTKARKLVETVFTWSAVARRTQEAVAQLDLRPATTALPKIAVVSTWNMRCGIASYAQHQVSAFPAGTVQVFASRCDERLGPDEPFVQRCWKQGWSDDLDDLYRAIRRGGATIAVIQFNFGFFDIESLGRLLDRLNDDGVACHVVLHSTLDVDKPERRISLSQIQSSLARTATLLVHGAADLNLLKRFGLARNAAIIPHGVVRPAPGDGLRVREALGLAGKRIVGCFGYMLPDKGYSTLIEAFLELRSRHSDLHLLLVTSLYPAPVSEQEAKMCKDLIAAHPEGRGVTLLTDYQTEEQVHRLLQAMDLLVFPYQQTQESSSGAVRFGLAASKPVACTPLPIFDDVGSVVHRFGGRSADAIARGIEDLLADPGRLHAHRERQQVWLAEHDWQAASARFWTMLRAPPILDLVAADRDALT